MRFFTIAALAFLVATPVFAQQVEPPNAAADEAPLPVIDAARFTEIMQGNPLIGSEDSGVGINDVATEESIFVVETGTMKSAEDWTAADRTACEEAGGIELAITADRIVCFGL